MKRIFLFSAIILCLLFSGCSTKSINSNQAFQQTCNANPVNNNESQEKQCCLKDSLETRIKHIEEICILKDPEQSKDSACNIPSSSSYTAASSSIIATPTNNTKIHGQLDYKNKAIIDSREGCFGANCQVNSILIESQTIKEKEKKPDCSLIYRYINILKVKYIHLIILTIAISVCWGFIILIPSAIKIAFNLMIIKSTKYINHRKTQKPKPDSYHVLAPTSYAKVSSEVLNQLKFAILEKNRRIKNIAITGPYGSGKSSIWKTFCRIYNVKKTKKIVKISLAKFNDPNERSFILNKNDELEIERAIIQQLIFSKKNTDLKYSSFPKINNLTYLKTTIPASILFIFFIFILPIINNSFFCFAESWVINPSIISTILLTFLLFFFYLLIFFSIQKLNKTRITKICLKECEITLGNNESLFAKYINDIVYYFEATKCNCVVIEDLDRFNSIQIFTKLREINDLINHYPAIKDTVKFVYIVRDDILSKFERTKFFDFIITIVPSLSIANSASITKENLENKGINVKDSFLNNIEDYLKDYRFVKNCINEILLYKKELMYFNVKLLTKENTTLSDEKLFSLILYKNLYPKDFSK